MVQSETKKSLEPMCQGLAKRYEDAGLEKASYHWVERDCCAPFRIPDFHHREYLNWDAWWTTHSIITEATAGTLANTCASLKIEQKTKMDSSSGNRTPVFRVTGGDTCHYTNEDCFTAKLGHFSKKTVKELSLPEDVTGCCMSWDLGNITQRAEGCYSLSFSNPPEGGRLLQPLFLPSHRGQQGFPAISPALLGRGPGYPSLIFSSHHNRRSEVQLPAHPSQGNLLALQALQNSS
ncbi:unnamed protein product [Pleuronectes platessa]|uniref:Uncharacterized protein n=1 Tax=Pleuronectes platessa TaxID=8262 RepID=A0A9N7YGY2_PLEPL|nr:unnamed protein product [Pleuronectes platessa]